MTEVNNQKNLSNFRRNQVGGVDADWTMLSGEVVPYTLDSSEIGQVEDIAEFDTTAFDEANLRASLLVELAEIDKATLRPLRAVLAGTGTEADKERLTELELRAKDIRLKL